jgi:thiamine biosynthesis protein ThiS
MEQPPMEITVNGKSMETRGSTISDLLAQLGIDASGIFIVRNREVVPKGMHQSMLICNGDRIEIIHFVEGG